MKRILVTGSRDWDDGARVAFMLGVACGQLYPADVVLVHGACPRGADKIAADIWRSYGLIAEAHPADWDTHGRRAGYVRNAEMVAAGADICLAFIKNDSPGATMTARLAQAAGITTNIVRA